VALCEGASRIGTEATPAVLAGLGNAANSRLRPCEATNIAEALRENLDHVRGLLTRLGILDL
jgi:hypothetical protein